MEGSRIMIVMYDVISERIKNYVISVQEDQEWYIYV